MQQIEVKNITNLKIILTQNNNKEDQNFKTKPKTIEKNAKTMIIKSRFENLQFD